MRFISSIKIEIASELAMPGQALHPVALNNSLLLYEDSEKQQVKGGL